MKELLFRIFCNKAYWLNRAKALKDKRWWVDCSGNFCFVRSKFRIVKAFLISEVKKAVLMAELMNRF